jgi:hypothetical protein
MGHIVHSDASGVQNIDPLFFLLGWAQCGLKKKHAGRSYIKLVFSHPIGSTGEVMQSGLSRTRKVRALFFCSGGIGIDATKSAMGHVTSNLCFCIWSDLCVTKCIPARPRSETLTPYFSCSGGPDAVSIKITLGQVMPNLCFWICWDMQIT